MRFCDIDRYQPGTRYKVLLSKNKDPIINHIILYDSNRRLFKGPPARSFKLQTKKASRRNKQTNPQKEREYPINHAKLSGSRGWVLYNSKYLYR